MSIPNLGEALIEAGVIGRDIAEWRMRHVVKKERVKITVYYCNGCGRRFGFYPTDNTGDSFYRCIGCGHKVAASQINKYAISVEEEA